MSKVKLFFSLGLATILFTACLPDTVEPPYGVWVSEDPRIVLYFKPQYQAPNSGWILRFLALYEIEGVDTRVHVHILPGRGAELRRLPADSKDDFFVTDPPLGSFLLGGTFRVERDGSMRWSLHEQGERNVGSIRFWKDLEYDPIDPVEWFPEYFTVE